ncbi:MAG: YggS family pyridoxal phosphate-dependent enzyme [Candidatus Eremiobacteraeota bacterium]|nr:YggS family pyridoxal phosphate-dependent enzyme [Candidatus Eremiobacteraeota bacterium]
MDFGFSLRGSGSGPSVEAEKEDSIRTRLARIREDIERTCIKIGRDPNSVTVVGITKTRTAEEIQPALDAGLDDLGENYIQEARQKAIALPGARWHMVGNLQRNKVNLAVDLFECIHSLNSAGLIHKLDDRCQARNRKLRGLLQVKLGGEKTKKGLDPAQVLNLLDELKDKPPQLMRLVGLMTIPPPVDDPEENRPHFQRLRELLEEIAARNYPFWMGSELSMGMSDDYLVAVEEGATMVRLGRVIFGERA